MNWGWMILVVVIALLIQTAVLPSAEQRWLDLMLALALVVGLVGPTHDARLFGWVVGFAKDLQSADPIGLHAFVLGLAITALTYLRDMVIRQHWWARWLIGFLVAMTAELITNIFLYAYAAHGTWWQVLSESVGKAAASAAVASFIAAVVVGLPSLALSGRRRAAVRW